MLGKRSNKTRRVEEIADDIREAREAGREIVPVVGAGLSADSGVPVITSVVRYFGKLQQYIRHGAYLPRGWGKEQLFEKVTKEYRDDPWKFIRDFGWPDRFQLNHDLLASGDPPGGAVEASVRAGLNAILVQLNPHGMTSYERLRAALLGVKDRDQTLTPGILDWDGATAERRIVSGIDTTVSQDLQELVAKTGAAEVVRQVLDQLRKKVEDRLDRDWSNSVAFDLVGDWKKLIQHFSRFQGDYADALFARLVAGRQPSQGHRYLAFLVKLLDVQTIFTYNFDDLIERALESEGVKHEVFSMEGGAGLPHHTLIREKVSVIKLHGTNHALLLDERLDYPLTDHYKRRFEQIAGKDPLLLVVGCSGNDYRLRDLVEHVLEQGHPGKGPAVVWFHYEQTTPKFLEEKEFAHTRVTNNPGATLLHLHSRLLGCNPASRVPYEAHVQRPIKLDVVAEKELDAISPKLLRRPEKSYLFNGSSETSDHSYPGRSASWVLIELANYWIREGYQTIWVDLESVHTLAGVVGSIIDQCRGFDPSLPPSVLPLEEGAEEDGTRRSLESRRIAVERVVHALRRTRYLVVLDGLETYVWPATAHHGVTKRCEGEVGQRLRYLCEFLRELASKRSELGESFLCLGVDSFKSRNPEQVLAGPIALKERLAEFVNESEWWEIVTPSAGTSAFRLTEFLEEAKDENRAPLLHVKDEAFKSVVEEVRLGIKEGVDQINSLVLFILSCFRRTRTLVAVRTLLCPILGSAGKVDKVLEVLATGNSWTGLVRLEGGGYWFIRAVRDYVYEKNSDSASEAAMKRCLENSCPSDKYRRSAFQLLLLTVAHQRIARVYFAETFVQSHDAFAFLEYSYHRLSSVRYLAKLLGLIRYARAGQPGDMRHAILRGVRQSRDIFRNVWKSDPPDKLLGDSFDEILSPDYDPADALEQVELDLQERHQRDIHSLHRAWVRSEGVLRSQLPAEQLLNWCRDIVEDDLKFRCNSVVVDYKSDKGNQPVLHRFTSGDGPPTEKVNPSAEREVESFRRFLKDFRVRILIERTDYDGAMHERLSLLRAGGIIDRLAPQRVKELVAAGSFPTIDADQCGLVHCHYLLDVADCILRYFQEFKTLNSELRDGARYTLNLLEQIETVIEGLEKPGEHSPPCQGGSAEDVDRREPLEGIPIEEVASFTGDLHEAYLRLHQLKAECLLGRVVVFSHDGFLGDGQEVDHFAELAQISQGEDEIHAGLWRVRDQDLQTGESPRSFMIDPTPDGSLYLQYRSSFNILRGRARWRRAFADGDAPRTSNGFEAALRDFELARGGLGGTNPLLVAVSELCVVEASLARARIILKPDPSRADGDLISTARAYYETARGALQRARQSLSSGRRNVVWWKKYLQLASQYQADRLLLSYVRWLQDWTSGPPLRDKILPHDIMPGESDRLARGKSPSREELAQFLVRLRRSYGAVRSAFDYFLPERSAGETSDTVRSRWLVRVWWEITLSSYATGILAADRTLGNNEQVAHRLVSEYLRWLNQRAMLDTCHEVKEMLKKFGGPKPDEDLLHLRPLLETGETALARRWEVLKMAKRLSTNA